MNHCKDCRFWELSVGRSGVCTRQALHHGTVSNVRGMYISLIGPVESGAYASDTPLLVNADFGCVHFEAKEQA